ncbi:magnesium-translocating P-type ATPase [Sphaerisporangium sp. NPDC051011]|uniref:magnesium-translocating P-type ATPase n=1 Tax=Sphaerisporangium sp. NPDC051011 TaxID=3155792 RepID=UPI0033EE9803
MRVATTTAADHAAKTVDLGIAASTEIDRLLTLLDTTGDGLTGAQARTRLTVAGPNAVRTHRARGLTVLVRQLRSPLLILLALTAAASAMLGESTDALIIAVILTASVGLGFFNEYRAEKSAEALHTRIRHSCLTWRDGHPKAVDVTEIVPGDVVELQLGQVVPADLRLLTATGLECEESALTGESMPVAKSPEPVRAGAALADLTCCALMGTVVSAGSGKGVVVATGGRAEFGKIALGLGQRHPDTEFQMGLTRFSLLLVRVAAVLTGTIFVVNLLLHRPVIDALLFSLAIAVGISPQLLPAVVSTSLAAGTRRLAELKVLVKRLICIEDLGDIDVLFTDKTGTLTEGRIGFMRSLGPDGHAADGPLALGLLCNEAIVGSGGRVAGGNPLDVALWQAPGVETAMASLTAYRRLAVLPFDHERRAMSVLVEDTNGHRTLVTKGAPEAVLARCAGVPATARAALAAEFAAGNRVVAVAGRPFPIGPEQVQLTPADERDLVLDGLLVFLDPPKSTAAGALKRLAGLGISVKVLTGDNPVVAAKLCTDIGLAPGRVLTGEDVDAADDDHLPALIDQATVFARVSPEHKARIIRAQRRGGLDVAFMGDGVNDALALHAADVGVSVDSATDVAKDAADVLLLEKDLNVLADGVLEGRRIFANTMKYVLMGTSSNFGNMVSAAGASLLLGFLPMLPAQILLNNLLYDTGQLAIPTDNVDPEQLARPSRWDVKLIRRFMLFFGPLSSLFDFATFALVLGVFHAGPELFRTSWFVESLATQALVIFVIRTRRTPSFHSRPSVPLLLATLGVIVIGVVLPFTPVAQTLGFQPLPGAYFAALAVMVLLYLGLIELGKRWFYREAPAVAARRPRSTGRRTHRRAGPFTTVDVTTIQPSRSRARRSAARR